MKKVSVMIATVLVLCVGCLVGHNVLTLNAQESEAIYEGVYIDGLNVGGMTKDQAMAAYEEYAKTLMAAKLELTAEDQKFTLSMDDLGLEVAGSEEAIETAYNCGRAGNLLVRYKEIQLLKKDSITIAVEKSVDEALFRKKLESIAEGLDVEPQNASIEKTSAGLTVIPEVKGMKVNLDTTVAKVMEALQAEWKGEDISVAMDVEVAEPEYLAADLEKVKDVIGTYTTRYTGTKDREQNLITGCSKINGSVVYPGEQLSVYEKCAPFTRDNGYRPANQYSNGEVITGIGGGICQVSTTLYNAALRAEMEIVQRNEHSMVVDYVPQAADAAIAGTYKDLKFKNTTASPIYVEAYASGGSITFTIYGAESRPANRTIEFESKVLAVYSPGEEIVTVDETKPVGYRKVEQSAHVGYSAELWKYIYEDGKLVESIKVNSSSYAASPARVTVGPEEETTEEEEDKDDDKTTEEDKDDDKTTEEDKDDKTTEEEKDDKTTEEDKDDKTTEEEKTTEEDKKDDDDKKRMETSGVLLSWLDWFFEAFPWTLTLFR